MMQHRVIPCPDIKILVMDKSETPSKKWGDASAVRQISAPKDDNGGNNDRKKADIAIMMGK
jgi:hypothetical protein